MRAAVDPLGRLPAPVVTPATEQARAQGERLAARVPEGTGEAGEVAAPGIRLEVVTPPEAKRGFVLLPRRRVVERAFAWTSRACLLLDGSFMVGGPGGPRMHGPFATSV